MTNERGPILRKRGTQPRDPEPPHDATPSAPAEPNATRPERSDPRPDPRPPARGPAPYDRNDGRNDGRRPPSRGYDGPPSPSRSGPPRGPDRAPGAAPSAAAGRRLYDPRAERGGPPAGGPARDTRDHRGAPPKRTDRAAKPPISDEKNELKGQAQKLAKEKGIPLVHAYRILKSQTSLNDVLKGLMRKERFESLVAREGIDRELAGQVASGHLSKQRATLLTRMRTLRKQKLHIDGIKAAEVDKRRVAIDIFGKGWLLGRVRTARPYDFDFLPDGADKPDRYFKHDAKAICAAEDFDAAQRATSVDDTVRTQGLAATEDRSARIRPEDDIMLRFIDDQRIVRFTMRDGEQLLGRLRSFGRWDAELVLDGGEIVTVFFHALHQSSGQLGHGA